MHSSFFSRVQPIQPGIGLAGVFLSTKSIFQPTFFIGLHFSLWVTTSKPGKLVAKLCQEQFCSHRCRSAATRSRTVPRGVCNFTGRGQQRPYTRSLAARPQTVSPWIAVAHPLVASRRSQACNQALMPSSKEPTSALLKPDSSKVQTHKIWASNP